MDNDSIARFVSATDKRFVELGDSDISPNITERSPEAQPSQPSQLSQPSQPAQPARLSPNLNSTNSGGTTTLGSLLGDSILDDDVMRLVQEEVRAPVDAADSASSDLVPLSSIRPQTPPDSTPAPVRSDPVSPPSVQPQPQSQPRLQPSVLNRPPELTQSRPLHSRPAYAQQPQRRPSPVRRPMQSSNSQGLLQGPPPSQVRPPYPPRTNSGDVGGILRNDIPSRSDPSQHRDVGSNSAPAGNNGGDDGDNSQLEPQDPSTPPTPSAPPASSAPPPPVPDHLTSIMGYNIPTATIYLIIVLVLIAFAIFYMTSETPKKKKEEDE